MLNYVILTTHSSHHYSMWDFTHSCISNNLPLTWESLPLYEPWTSPTHFPLPNGPFPSLVHHPWASTCQSRTSFILHGNLTPHCCLAPLAIILICWAFKRSFVWVLWACLVQSTMLAPTTKGICLAPFVKGLQVCHTPCSYSNFKRNLINLASFVSHYRGL